MTGCSLLFQNVNVSTVEAPYEVLFTTDQHGDFSIPDICVGESLLFQKPGYVDQTHDVVSVANPVQINMLLIGKSLITICFQLSLKMVSMSNRNWFQSLLQYQLSLKAK